MITSYPPSYIIGPVVEEEAKVILEEDSEMATVTLEEINAEYMYSNPQGIFNLSVPDKTYRTVNYHVVSYSSWKIDQLKQAE